MLNKKALSNTPYSNDFISSTPVKHNYRDAETEIKQRLSDYVQSALKPLQQSKPATLNPKLVTILLSSTSIHFIHVLHSIKQDPLLKYAL